MNTRRLPYDGAKAAEVRFYWRTWSRWDLYNPEAARAQRTADRIRKLEAEAVELRAKLAESDTVDLTNLAVTGYHHHSDFCDCNPARCGGGV